MLQAKAAISILCWAAAAHAAELPSGTQLEIRLKTHVGSAVSKTGDPVEAILISPAVSGADIVLPAGSTVQGSVKQAVPIKAAGDRAVLELDFSKIVLTGGTLKLESKLVVVENARESVDQTGRITGILASETLASRINTGVKGMSETHSKLSDFLGTVTSSVLKEPEPEIDYQPGVEMTLELTKPLQSTVKITPPSFVPVTPETAIYDTVNSQPFQTKTEGPQGIPSDMTNLMFLGSPEQLLAAFTAAGWNTAARLNTSSGLETFRAVAEMRGYKEAPMSILLLDGNKPDFDFEKQNNTFAKRHHLRIWRRPGDFQGHPIWVCAATHDIGIDFSVEKRNFIHKIDSEIDRERAKVVNDLLLSGHAGALSLVARPATPQHSMNATGDKLETDGRMAVLLLD